MKNHINPQVPHGPAAPGQTNAHRGDSPDDPMKEMNIDFSVRLAVAKGLLSGSF